MLLSLPSRVLALLLVGLSATVIWVRAATVNETYSYIRQEQTYRKLQQEIQATRVRWLKLTTPKRLEAMAARLGLRPGDSQRILKYEPDKIHARKLP